VAPIEDNNLAKGEDKGLALDKWAHLEVDEDSDPLLHEAISPTLAQSTWI
jgi:hypothetical protein